VINNVLPNILMTRHNLVKRLFKLNHDRRWVFFRLGIITNVKVRPIIEALYQQG